MHTAWDIYAHRLMHLGHGHPLWGPEPSERFGEVRLGDVGYLQEGRFCFLFNAMRSADDPVNSRGVPFDFVVFSPPDAEPVHWPNAITRPQLCSESLRSVQVDASVSVSSEAITSGLRYQCIDNSGALLLLKQPAHKTFLDCKLLIKKYMATHLDSWCEFANDTLGIGLKDKDIIFVSGFTKTTVWAEAAFSDILSSPGVASFPRVSISHEGPASIESRDGPRDRISAWGDGRAREYPYDQCIFLNYCKMKRRVLLRGPRVVRAAAGPHMLPDGDRDDGGADTSSIMSTSSDSQESDDVGESYDPADEILDYILKNSTVEVACVSDEDLSSLFSTNDIPNDLRTTLDVLAPQIVGGDPELPTAGTISLARSFDEEATVFDIEGGNLASLEWYPGPGVLTEIPFPSAGPAVAQIIGARDAAHDFPNIRAQCDQETSTRERLTCPYCNSTFSRTYDPQAHVNSVHLVTRSHVCGEPDCSRAFSRKHDLLRHHQAAHTNLGSHRNSGNPGAVVPGLTTAMELNADAFVFDAMDRTLFSLLPGPLPEPQWQEHAVVEEQETVKIPNENQRIRLGSDAEPDFPLDGSSNHDTALPKRKRKLDTTKRFPCPHPGCSSMFARTNNLKVHVDSVHLVTRSHICDEPGCSRAFSRKYDLLRHHQSAHTNLGSPRNSNNPQAIRTDEFEA